MAVNLKTLDFSPVCGELLILEKSVIRHTQAAAAPGAAGHGVYPRAAGPTRDRVVGSSFSSNSLPANGLETPLAFSVR